MFIFSLLLCSSLAAFSVAKLALVEDWATRNYDPIADVPCHFPLHASRWNDGICDGGWDPDCPSSNTETRHDIQRASVVRGEISELNRHLAGRGKLAFFALENLMQQPTTILEKYAATLDGELALKRNIARSLLDASELKSAVTSLVDVYAEKIRAISPPDRCFKPTRRVVKIEEWQQGQYDPERDVPCHWAANDEFWNSNDGCDGRVDSTRLHDPDCSRPTGEWSHATLRGTVLSESVNQFSPRFEAHASELPSLLREVSSRVGEIRDEVAKAAAGESSLDLEQHIRDKLRLIMNLRTQLQQHWETFSQELGTLQFLLDSPARCW
jgi:hypothetical protein